MQISSGWAKGMRLQAPAGEATRPTSAKVRAALLNILQTDIPDALILDLFAGSGAVGLEAVSRGARGCVFIERAPAAMRALQQNIAELRRRGATQGIEVVTLEALSGDAGDALARLDRFGSFDLIFADPPYRDAISFLSAHAAALAALLTNTGVLAIETASSDAPAMTSLGAEQLHAVHLELAKQRTYGDTMISIWCRT